MNIPPMRVKLETKRVTTISQVSLFREIFCQKLETFQIITYSVVIFIVNVFPIFFGVSCKVSDEIRYSQYTPIQNN